MEQLLTGRYFDGRTAQGRAVRLAEDGICWRLELEGQEAEPLLWPRTECRWRTIAGSGHVLEHHDDAAYALFDRRPPRAGRTRRLFARASFADSRRLIRLGVASALALAGLLALVHSALPALIRRTVPVDTEAALGEQLLPQLVIVLGIGGHGRACPMEGRLTANLTAVVNRLVLGTRYHYQIDVYDSPIANAFALPGGHIVLTTGLIAALGSAPELVAVLAHEVTHVEKRHGLTSMIQASGDGALLSAVFGNAGSFAAQLGALNYSRQHEREADAGALERLERAGYDPGALNPALAHLAAASRMSLPPGLAFLSTHPDLEERLQATKRDGETSYPPGIGNVSWQLLRALCKS
ncbi:M48 family metallopeptidase [Radicibacter daui]|uniref:M48 family metallopeptidase n=1 Tax=Radicibacter daui TaxID=3064829 RepID=UPI004046933D